MPYKLTNNHLRNWGYAYLGNMAMADALIGPVTLRQEILPIVDDDKKCAPVRVTSKLRVVM